MASNVRSKWYGDLARQNMRTGQARGLRLAAEFVKEKSVEVVPIDRKPLMQSAAVDSNDKKAVVYYDTPYAVIQHEALDFQHKAGRQAKYLEEPLYANSGKVQKLIGEAIDAQIGGR